MSLHIDNPTTDRLARELAQATGEPIEDAVNAALKERLQRVRNRRVDQSLLDELNSIAIRCASLPVFDTRSPDEILGYDENGLPT